MWILRFSHRSIVECGLEIDNQIEINSKSIRATKNSITSLMLKWTANAPIICILFGTDIIIFKHHLAFDGAAEGPEEIKMSAHSCIRSCQSMAFFNSGCSFRVRKSCTHIHLNCIIVSSDSFLLPSFHAPNAFKSFALFLCHIAL